MILLPKKTVTDFSGGFTLIELLVVVAVIGILAGILVAVLDPSEYLAQTRDSKRLNDVLLLQTTITNAITNGHIALVDTSSCLDCNSVDGSLDVDGTGWVKFTNNSGRGLRDFIQALPKDPTNSNSLKYEYYSDGELFELNTALESQKYAENAQIDGGNDPNTYERGTDLELN